MQNILSKLATVIYPLCFKKQTLELLRYLSFKIELSTKGLQAWRSPYTGHVEVRMISNTGGGKNLMIKNHTI